LTESYRPPLLTRWDSEYRLSWLVNSLNDWGEVEYAKRDPDPDSWIFFWAVAHIDSFEGSVVDLIFTEEFRATYNGWLLLEYQYNYSDTSRRLFYGYHNHRRTVITSLEARVRSGAPSTRFSGGPPSRRSTPTAEP
jgi:hypothetical protein